MLSSRFQETTGNKQRNHEIKDNTDKTYSVTIENRVKMTQVEITTAMFSSILLNFKQCFCA